MFCYQCQEALNNKGCTVAGVCGKDNDTANLQDLLIYSLKGIAVLIKYTAQDNITPQNTHLHIAESLFATITNANFDKEYFINRIIETLEIRDTLKTVASNVPKEYDELLNWRATEKDSMLFQAKIVGVMNTEDEDIRSLKELLTYGIKGMAAYHFHAAHLGFTSDEVFAFTSKALAATAEKNISADDLTTLVLEAGKYGVEVMALLDKANTSTYGNPEITKVSTGVKNNPAILVSGHDLKDLEQLLEQTKGTGVDVYTHSEMLPAHYYPKFKQYDNFVGNYGNAWWQQHKEFESFNGVVLLTTNCLVPPKQSYKNRVYITGPVGFEGLKRVKENSDGTKDFSELIAHAKTLPSPTEIENGEIVGGFAHNQVLALADKVVDAVKSGAVKKFVVMAGCDGRHKERDYYSNFANGLPEDNIILTAGCAKYRYNKLELGDIGGIPRVLDAGQCNDSYSLAVVALKLKEVFELDDINELPIVYNIAWYEQKAVIVLLALLHLGVKNIHLGPTLPAFLSPNVANILVETFGIGGITTPEEDLQTMMV